MFARACWLTLTLLLVSSGCQTPNTALLPWQGDSGKPSLTEAELNRTLDGPTLNEEAFGAASSVDDSSPTLSNLSSNENDRIEKWLSRGQEAIRQAAESPHRDQLLREATNSFRESLKLDADNVDAFHGLAIVSDLSEDWEMAEMNYKRALSVRRDDVNLLNDLGYSYLLQKRFDEASRYLNRATQIDPRHEKAHINLAILEVQKGNQQAAFAQLSRIYGNGQAQSALAGIVNEHGLSASNRGMTTVSHQQAIVPPPAQENNRAEVEMYRPLTANVPQTTAMQTQPQMSVPQQWTGKSTDQQHQPLFSQNGLLRAPAPRSPVQPVGATGDQIQQQATAPATQQSATGPQQRSPSGRSVGQVVQLQAQTAVIRPQLPASANVYNPVTPPAFQADRVAAQAVSQSTPASVPAGAGNRQLSVPQPAWQPPVRDDRRISVLPHQMQSGHPGAGGRYHPGQAPMNRSSQQQGQFNPAGSHYGQPLQATGQPQMYSSGSTGNNGAANPTHGQQQAPPANTPAAPSPYSAQQGFQGSPSIQGTLMNPAGYQQQVAGVPPSGVYPGQQPVITNGGQQSLTPQYFAPPPVNVPGFHDPIRTVPDRLAEYRAERQQQENEYQQALQNVARPLGGSSFQ